MNRSDRLELCFSSATGLARDIRRKEVSCTEVMAAHLTQIEEFNPSVNAVVTTHPERSMELAKLADEKLHRNDNEAVGALHGLPVAHKDLFQTQGVRTTYGSPIFRDNIPELNDVIVARAHAAGAIPVGKTNTPEFGAGSQTFNPVFGATKNPYDPTKTCGGSSGGSAVALACGLVPLADGSDMGGSLRNPASFCNVVGLRPSVGRVPSWPADAAFNQVSVPGPMARSVEDLALFLSALAGPDARAPLSVPQPGSVFAASLNRDFSGVRIAFSPDLGDFPLDPEVRRVFSRSRPGFESLGCTVMDEAPDFTGADEVFKTLRAWHFELAHGDLLDSHRGQLKDTVVWNIEEGRKLTGPQLGRAEKLRTALHGRVTRFMESHEFLVLPTVQVPPFPVDQPYIEEIAGATMETYIDWMKSCYYITTTGLPAVSVPGGFTADGLPVGVQIVGRWQDDLGVLRLAHAFEQATKYGTRKPGVVV
ncbi:amidase [Rubrobacter indicoceani]|uniref:amidase n=1 Tax=Rubrobacter indicoceani TaxID=2051957 RepID=UPI000E5B458D|nr:amidase [Rubrobacter indicoceani]